MLMNNLDPEGRPGPGDLVVYGGRTGRAARSWQAFDAILASLRKLDDDQTLWSSRASRSGVPAPTNGHHGC